MMHQDIERWIQEIRAYNRVLHLMSEAMTADLEEDVFNTMKLLEHIHEPAITDLGSGSGLPAIPYKIMYPQSSLIMVERSQKKCTFLRHVIDILNLENIELIGEDLLATPEPRRFDAIMSRAFSPLKTLEKVVTASSRPGSRLYYLSTGRSKPVHNEFISLADHHEQRCRRYTMHLDIYELTSRQQGSS